MTGESEEDAALPSARARTRRRVDKLVELCFFIYYVTNSNTLFLCRSLIVHPVSSSPYPFHIITHPP